MQESARLIRSQALATQAWVGIFNLILSVGIAQAQNVTNFNPGPNGSSVNVLAIQSDGKLLAGGAFTEVCGAEPHTLRYLARITFTLGFTITQSSNQCGPANPDGPCYSSSLGSCWNGNGRCVSTEPLCRFNGGPGVPDPSFNDPNIDNVVSALVVQGDGQILVGGGFTHIGSVTRAKLGRLNTDGTPDQSFADPLIVGNTVKTLALQANVLQANGQILVGGDFTGVGGLSFHNLVRLNTDGTVDPAFGILGDAQVGGIVNALVIQPDGKILVGGAFTTIQSVTRNRIARLNSNGTLDTTFRDIGNTNGAVLAIALQANGQIVIGGQFDTINGQPQNHLARLNADGTSDASYMNAQTDSYVYALALQPDGKLLAGGAFNIIGPMGMTQSHQKILRLHPNGALDISFPDLAADYAVNAIAVGQSNYLLVGGAFTSIGSQTRNHLAQLGNEEIFKDNFETN